MTWLRRLRKRMAQPQKTAPLSASQHLRFAPDSIASVDELVTLVTEAMASGPAAIAAALSTFLMRAGPVAEAARGIQRELLDEATAQQVRHFDEQVRRLHRALPPPHALDVQHIDDVRTLAVLCAHPRGHVRQACVVALFHRVVEAGTLDAFAARMIALRLRDWVAAVRRSAAATLRGHLRHPALRTPYVAAWPLLCDLEKTRGHDQRDAVAQLRLCLFEEAADEVAAQLDGPRDVARSAAQLLAGVRDAGIVARLCAHRDPTVRDAGVRAAAAAGRGDLVDAALRDSVPQVAAAAVQRSHNADALRRLLISPSGTVRREVRARLLDLAPDEDVAAHAAGLFLEGRPVAQRVGIVELWADLGLKAQWGAIEPALADPSPRVRAAALRALDVLDEDRCQPFVLHHLVKDEGRACKAAARAVRRRGHALDAAPVLAAYAADRPAGRAALLDAIAAQPTWTGLFLLAQLAAAGAEGERYLRTLDAVGGRLGHRAFVVPRAEQVARIQACLPKMTRLPKARFTFIMANFV